MEKLYGNYLGLCINNHDPDFRGRVQVFIPHIMPALYERWNREGADKKIQLVGNNLETALPKEDIEQLKLMLPWAEAAAPVFGNSVAGHYNQQSGNFNQTYGTENQNAAAGSIEGNAGSTNISGSLTDFVKEFEGFNPNAYWDNGQWSIGYGTFAGSNRAAPDISGPITQQEGSVRLQAELNKAAGFVNNALTRRNITLTQRQIDALTSYTYNRGPGGLNQLLNNSGNTWESIGPNMVTYWGSFQPARNGLIRRRNAELAFGNATSVSLNDPANGVLNASSNPAQTTPHGMPAPDVYTLSTPSDNAIQKTVADAGFSGTLPGTGLPAPGVGSGNQVNVPSGSLPRPSNVSIRSGETAPNSKLLYLLGTAATRVYGAGSTVEVFSGQEGRSGGTQRHPGGWAADVYFKDPNGNTVTGDRLARVVQFWHNNQLGSTGLNWGGGKIHIDLVGGRFGRPLQGGETLWWSYGGGLSSTMREAISNVDPSRQRYRGENVPTTLTDQEIANLQAGGEIAEGPAIDGSMVRNPTETQTSVTDTNGMPQGLFSVPNPGAMLWVFFREGDPLFPVYFAASYGAQEWKNAFKGSSPDAHYPQEGDTTPRNQAIFRPNQSGGMSFVDTITDEEDCRSIRMFHSNGAHFEFHQRGSILYQPFEHMQQVAGNAYNSCLNREDWTQGTNNSVTIGDRVTIVGNMSQEALDIIDQHAQIVKEINRNMLKGGGGPNGGAPSRPLNVTPNTPGLTVTPNANVINGFENTVTGPITPVTPNANLINGFQGTNLTTITPQTVPPAATQPPPAPTVTVNPANGILNGII